MPDEREKVGSRPDKTITQRGAKEIDWTRTFHVDTALAFVNGLFALHQNLLDDFIQDAGGQASVGETVLYQVANPLHLRFEIKKLGPNEYQVRGAHFAGPQGVNICVGLNPDDNITKEKNDLGTFGSRMTFGNFPLPPGFPTVGDFAPDQIVTQPPKGWDFHRNPGSGGHNFGQDMIADNQAAVVGVEVHVESDHNTKGGPDFHIVTRPVGVVTVPIGFHAGHRLEPGNIIGPGATFKGNVVFKVVSLQDWLHKALHLVE